MTLTVNTINADTYHPSLNGVSPFTRLNTKPNVNSFQYLAKQ